MNILLLGPPGSGKGTIAAMLVDNFGFTHLSTGNLFRYHIKNQTPLGKEVKEILDSGKLVPDDVTIKLVESELKEGTQYLFDGFPRTIPQAKAFDKIDVVVYFEISQEEVVTRFANRVMDKEENVYNLVTNPPPQGVEVYQRDDDKPEVVRKRFVEYQVKTHPLVEYYTQKGILKTIDARPMPGVVYEEVKRVLESLKD